LSFFQGEASQASTVWVVLGGERSKWAESWKSGSPSETPPTGVTMRSLMDAFSWNSMSSQVVEPATARSDACQASRRLPRASWYWVAPISGWPPKLVRKVLES
jgi:hypothetical protein